MDIVTSDFTAQITKVFFNFYGSNFAFGLKFFLAIYSAVLIADVILIIIVHTPGMYLRVLQTGSNVPVAHKEKMQKRWKKVLSRLRSRKDAQFKVAVLEADSITDEILSQVGYQGINMGERLDGISANQLEMIEELKKAHEVRNEIVHKADFVLDRKTAHEVVGVYQKVLETLEFI
jgi:hypothetical protein